MGLNPSSTDVRYMNMLKTFFFCDIGYYYRVQATTLSSIYLLVYWSRHLKILVGGTRMAQVDHLSCYRHTSSHPHRTNSGAPRCTTTKQPNTYQSFNTLKKYILLTQERPQHMRNAKTELSERNRTHKEKNHWSQNTRTRMKSVCDACLGWISRTDSVEQG